MFGENVVLFSSDRVKFYQISKLKMHKLNFFLNWQKHAANLEYKSYIESEITNQFVNFWL